MTLFGTFRSFEPAALDGGFGQERSSRMTSLKARVREEFWTRPGIFWERHSQERPFAGVTTVRDC